MEWIPSEEPKQFFFSLFELPLCRKATGASDHWPRQSHQQRWKQRNSVQSSSDLEHKSHRVCPTGKQKWQLCGRNCFRSSCFHCSTEGFEGKNDTQTVEVAES